MFKSMNQVLASVWDELGNALRVTLSSASSSGALTDRSGAIAALDVAQVVMAANPARKYLLFTNVSDTDMWLNFGIAAVKDSPSFLVKAGGGSLVMEGSFVSSELLSVICAAAGKKYTAKEA